MPENQPTILEKLRRNRLQLATITGVVAVAAFAGKSNSGEAAPPQINLAPPQAYIGMNSAEMFSENLAEAEDAAKRIADSGANTARIIAPYTTGKGGQAEINNDAQEYCNAAQAAYDNNLNLIIAFNGFGPSQKKETKGQIELGHVPESPAQIRRFKDTLIRIVETVSTEPDPNGKNGGCVPGLKKFIFEPDNEVNSRTFNRNQTPDTAEKYMNLLSKLNPVKERARQPDIKAEIIIAAGALATSQDPVGFADRMGQAMAKLKISTVPFDILTAHVYPRSPEVDPVPTEQNLYKGLKPIVDKYFNGVPIIWDEVAVNSVPPLSKRHRYTETSVAVSEAKQAQYYENFYKTAACQPGVIGGLIFQLTDDGKWSSGPYAIDKTPKSSLPQITKSQKAALAGGQYSC